MSKHLQGILLLASAEMESEDMLDLLMYKASTQSLVVKVHCVGT